MIGPIERDETMDREYIPMPGGWEVQTKGKGSTFRIAGPVDGDRLAIEPRPYLHETLTKMAREVHAGTLAIEAELNGKIEVLEQFRPLWAQGYTNDSVAAQTLGGALTRLWKMLGVSNQTDAVQALKRMQDGLIDIKETGLYEHDAESLLDEVVSKARVALGELK